jgi:putative endonuclease
MRAGVTVEAVKSRFYYTYVLLCGDSKLYIGHAKDLRVRFSQHRSGQVQATAHRLPVQLVYYEACLDLSLAKTRERQLKTGFGRAAYLKRRLRLA